MEPNRSRSPVRAAGVVVVNGPPGSERFLLLHNPLHDEWGFPKGHLEEGEEDLAGALREAKEETGIERLEIVPSFREEIGYRISKGGRRHAPDPGLEKRVVYFLARAPDPAHSLSREHDRAGWYTEDEALALLKHENLREVARRAARRLREESR